MTNFQYTNFKKEDYNGLHGNLIPKSKVKVIGSYNEGDILFPLEHFNSEVILYAPFSQEGFVIFGDRPDIFLTNDTLRKLKFKVKEN